MILQELLDSLGIDKRQLAKIADISVKSLTRMQDDVEQYVLDAVDQYRHDGGLAEVIPVASVDVPDVPVATFKHKPASQCTGEEIRSIWKRRGSETDYDIAHSMGMRVCEFRREYLPGR